MTRSILATSIPIAVALGAGCSFDSSGFDWPSDGAVSIDAAHFDAQVPIDAGPDADVTQPDARPDATPAIDARPADAAQPDADVPDPIEEDVIHVPDGGEFSTLGELVLDSDVTIDTTALTIGGSAPPADVVFDNWAQSGGGPDLAVLHVRSLTIESGIRVTVIGGRPLVILASRAVQIAGTLDASADHTAPGAGGAPPGSGPGAGGDGTHQAPYYDGGGGGAGFGTDGAAGGASVCNPSCTDGEAGAAGTPYGTPELPRLGGGSGGGSGAASDCSATVGGGGGGAIQIYSATSITITGNVAAGGGGGSGGISIGCANATAGGGGGSGGAIFLQAPTVSHSGILAANGGGGGGGASGASASDGGDGDNAGIGTTVASGGASGGSTGQDGGDGGALDTAPTEGGTSTNQGNGGGGGGAVGRIAVMIHSDSSFTPTGAISPAPFTGTY